MVKPVVITFLADDKKFNRSLSNVEGRLDRFSRRATHAGNLLTVGVTAPIVALGKVAFDTASDLEQSIGAVDTVFGDSAHVIKGWGDTAADAAGLSRREVNEMAAKVGAGLQGLGFTVSESADLVVDLEKRAADLAATFGGTTSDAIDAVAALMRGERDPIEKYGVAIKQADVNARVLALGLDTSTTAAKKNAEAVATLDLLMAQTARTEGAFAKEANTAAGAQARAKAQFENAAAALGNQLLPAGAKAIDMLSGMFEAFNRLSPEMQGTIVKIAGVAAAVGPLLIITGKLITAVRVVKTAMEGASGSMGKAGFAGGALLLSSIAVPALIKSFQEAEVTVKNLTAAMIDGRDVAHELAVEVFTSQLGPALLEAGVSADTLKKAIEGDAEALKELERVGGIAGKLLDELIGRYETATDRADRATAANQSLAASIGNVAAAGTSGNVNLQGGPGQGGSFQHGGVVPGATGQPRLVVAHGGETITPPVKQGGGGEVIVVQIDGREIARAVRDHDRRVR